MWSKEAYTRVSKLSWIGCLNRYHSSVYPLGHLSPNSMGKPSTQDFAYKWEDHHAEKTINLFHTFLQMLLCTEFVGILAEVRFGIGFISADRLHNIGSW